MPERKIEGHVMAFVAVCVWGVTYIATKILLAYYTEMQVMVLRFALAYLALLVMRPRFDPPLDLRDEAGLFLLSFFGITLYYLLENIALGYSSASNVSIIVSSAPIVTAFAIHLFGKNSRMDRYTLMGFVFAIVGVIMVVYNGAVVLHLNLKGDLLAFGSTISWAVYSLLLKHYLDRFDGLLITRRILLYGLIVSIPLMLILDGMPDLPPLLRWDTALSLLLLGVFGNALCYLWWNSAIARIGVVMTTNYIYLSPFITMVSAYFILDEPITVMGLFGAGLIILGIVVSARTQNRQKN